MAETFPETGTSEAAEEGNRLHALAEEMILSAAQSGTYTGEEDETARLYADTVIAKMREYGVFGGDGFGVERRVEIPSVSGVCFGTVDAFLVHPRERKLFLGDLKTGRGLVEVYENEQLMTYAAGVCDTLGLHSQSGDLVLEFCIVQPRAYHPDGSVRKWTTTMAEIKPHIERLRAAAAEALTPNPRTVSGSHCRYCKGRHACAAAIQGGVSLYEAVGDSIPYELSAAEASALLSLVKRATEQLEYIRTGLEADVEGRLRNGEKIPGWTLTGGAGRREWNRPEAELLTLAGLLKLDIKEARLVTPAQAEKRGVPKAIVAQYVTTKSKQKLKQDGDRARQIFTTL